MKAPLNDVMYIHIRPFEVHTTVGQTTCSCSKSKLSKGLVSIDTIQLPLDLASARSVVPARRVLLSYSTSLSTFNRYDTAAIRLAASARLGLSMLLIRFYL